MKIKKVIKTIGKIYGILWLVENSLVARGIALDHYMDMVEDRCSKSLPTAKTIMWLALKSQSDCEETAISGWKRLGKIVVGALKK